MAKISIPCGHEDWPCCGCENFAYTGADAVEQTIDDELDRYDNDRPPDEIEDDGEGYDPCSMAAWEDRFEAMEY